MGSCGPVFEMKKGVSSDQSE